MPLLLAVVTALLSVLLGAVCWVLYALLRQNGRMLLRLERAEAALADLRAPDDSGDGVSADPLAKSRIPRGGLPAGTIAPDFTLPLVDGGEVSLGSYAGRWLLLVFTDPECAPCLALLPRLERASRASEVAVLLVSRRDAAANRRKIAEAGVTMRMALQNQWEISRLYAKFATPVAYLIDPRGRIAEPVATGAEAILALYRNARHADTRTAQRNPPQQPVVH